MRDRWRPSSASSSLNAVKNSPFSEGSSSTFPNTFLASSLQRRERGNLEAVGPLVSSLSLSDSLWLMGDECRRDETEETLLLRPILDECLRLKKAKAMDEDRSRPLARLLLDMTPGAASIHYFKMIITRSAMCAAAAALLATLSHKLAGRQVSPPSHYFEHQSRWSAAASSKLKHLRTGPIPFS